MLVASIIVLSFPSHEQSASTALKSVHAAGVTAATDGSEGWVLANKFQSCTDACGELNLQCKEDDFAQHASADASTVEGMNALMTLLYPDGTTCPARKTKTGKNKGSAPSAVVSRKGKLKACYVPSPTRTYDCNQVCVSAVRYCYCSAGQATEPPEPDECDKI